MTQTEQNSAFRSRDVQQTALIAIIEVGDMIDPFKRMEAAKLHILEAESRGAAEQRRKDGEGREMRQENALLRTAMSTVASYARGYAEPTCSVEFLSLAVPEGVRLRIVVLEARIADLMEAEQLARTDAEASKARVKVLERALSYAVSALEQVTDGERGGYNARNGKFVSLQMSDGERADIIHSDVTTECEGALENARAALTREGGV